MSRLRIFLLIPLVVATLPLVAGIAGDVPPVRDTSRYVSPAEARLRNDVAYLADDLREGRGVGTRGLDDAADYIATVFREAGLKTPPGMDTYFQPFPVRGELTLGSPTQLTLHFGDGVERALALGESFQPLAVGASGKADRVPIVFAGFGITAKDPAAGLDYDDYAEIDARDKVVLILRRDPSPADPSAPFAGDAPTSYATFTAKVANAAQHGAKAVLLVNDAGSAEAADKLLDYRATPGGGTIPFIMIPRHLASQLLESAGAPPLLQLEAAINATGKPQSRELPNASATYEITSERKTIMAKNVVGVIEGQGPLAEETIVVGGHYDHLGLGGMGSLAMGSREIHNGADDNASGTAVVLELARRFAARSEPLPRRIVFVLFSAEESGLIGSAYFVNHPPYPLENLIAMFNYDMVGRYDENRGLIIYGAGTAEGWQPLVESLATTMSFKPKLAAGTSDGFSDSDHSSFYKKGIPVLFFFTGTHAQYHRPGDDTHLINSEGMTRIADLGELLLLELARRPQRPAFVSLAPPRPRTTTATLGGGGAYLGSRPAYGEDVEGVKLDGVTEGSPAEKAGLQAGDVIVRFGGLKVSDVESYMVALGSKKPGDEVEIVVLRDGQERILKATLGSRPTAQNAPH